MLQKWDARRQERWTEGRAMLRYDEWDPVVLGGNCKLVSIEVDGARVWPPAPADANKGLAENLERIAAALERQSASTVSAIPPEALSKADAARFIGADEATIEQLIRTRRLAYIQIGSQRGRVIALEALRAFLKQHRQATGEEMLKERKRR